MKRTGKGERRRSTSPGRKERRKRAAKALAAAGAIAGGAQAYALPVRFDNPPHGEPGHFDWVGPIGQYVELDFALSPEDQTGDRGPTTVAQMVHETSSNLVTDGALQAGDGDYRYFVVGVSAGELIPTDGTVWQDYPAYIYSRYIPLSLLPTCCATYLGVRFDVGSGYQYAWIGVVRPGLELEAFAWGYETEPGVPIEAGAPGEGACCGPGPCQEITEAECEAMGWKYIGDGVTCEEAGCNYIPTVSEWGLAIMALALLAAGTWVVRKRIPKPSEA